MSAPVVYDSKARANRPDAIPLSSNRQSLSACRRVAHATVNVVPRAIAQLVSRLTRSSGVVPDPPYAAPAPARSTQPPVKSGQTEREERLQPPDESVRMPSTNA